MDTAFFLFLKIINIFMIFLKIMLSCVMQKKKKIQEKCSSNLLQELLPRHIEIIELIDKEVSLNTAICRFKRSEERRVGKEC